MVGGGSKCGEDVEKEMTGSCGDLGPGPAQPRKVREASRWGCCLARGCRLSRKGEEPKETARGCGSTAQAQREGTACSAAT